MFRNVVEDVRLQLPPRGMFSPVTLFFYLLFKQELHAVLIYRYGHWVRTRCRVPGVRQLLLIAYLLLSKMSEMLFGVWVRPESEIGPGLKIEHAGGIIFGPGRAGRGCRVSSQVVVGHIGGFRGGGLPVLGDNVYIGAGAKILGDVRVGNDVVIGANAVVITDVPDGSLAVGVPAQVKQRRKSGGSPAGGADGTAGP